MKDWRIPLRSVWNNAGNRHQRGRRLVRALGWQLTKRLSPHPRTMRLATGASFRAYPDCVVSSSLIYADWPEFHELMFVRRTLQKGDVAIDVGANVGHVLLSISDMVSPARLIAFEPTPVSFERLKENWLLNDWPVENLYQLAVGEAAGTMYIANTKTPVTTNTLEDRAHADTTPVRVVSLDEMAHSWTGLQIGLLKIDVEGFERSVFRGAKSVLRELRPRLIMFESLQGSLDPEIGAILGSCDYQVFQLDAEGEPSTTETSAQNLFAAPRDLIPALVRN
ncbi:MAG TPA: FkbM family methyltransferase [Chthoniobacterales bacterium]|jgi:FkbM family methyltransferase|nr:FkbM family methyltransferase [Chthoniobacterales bacterium]